MHKKAIKIWVFLFFLAGLIFLMPGTAYAKNGQAVRLSKPRAIFVGEETTVKVFNLGKHKATFQINRKGLDKVNIIKKTKNSIVLKGKKAGIVNLAVKFEGGKKLKTSVKVEKNDRVLRLDQDNMVIDDGDYGRIAAYFGEECVSSKTKWTVSDPDGLYLGTFDAAENDGSWEVNTVYGITPGTYVLYASFRGKTASCKVTVKKTSNRWLELCRLKERAQKYHKVVKKALRESVKKKMTDLEKAKALAEWLCDYLDYDETFEKNSEEEAFVDGISACEGYAEAYNVLLNKVGVKSCVVHGRAYPKKKSKKYESHAWNIIYIEGQWYHVDVTWMDRRRKISYKSFMKSTAYFAKKKPMRKNWTVEYYNFPELFVYLHTRPETGDRFDKVTAKEWKNGGWKQY